MRVAVYGGSFNPPHVSHAMVCAWLRWTARVDQVLLVPVFRHAFEGQHGKALAPFDLRLRWCRAFAEDVGGGVEVSEIEAHLPVPSFTIETLRWLASSRPEDQLRLVVGADVLPQLPRWRDWDSIAAHFSPIIVGRAGYPSPPDSVAFPDISSTEIRARLLAGASVDHLLTGRVAALLRDDPAVPEWL